VRQELFRARPITTEKNIMPHYHDPQRPDMWTNIAAGGEATASFISDAYWLATSFDVMFGCIIKAFGLSFYGLSFGVVMALLSAGGAAYSHRTLNTHHQTRQSSEEPVDSEDREVQDPLNQMENNSLISDEQPDSSHEHPHLTAIQKLALIGDAISHTGDIAGPVTFVFNLAINNVLSRFGRALLLCGASLFGAISAVANVRTCRDAMVTTNRINGLHQDLPV